MADLGGMFSISQTPSILMGREQKDIRGHVRFHFLRYYTELFNLKWKYIYIYKVFLCFLLITEMQFKEKEIMLNSITKSCET